jgi:hypothetical protein
MIPAETISDLQAPSMIGRIRNSVKLEGSPRRAAIDPGYLSRKIGAQVPLTKASKLILLFNYLAKGLRPLKSPHARYGD